MLGEVFHSAWMHFSYFIKPQKWSLLYRHYLLGFMVCGIATFRANRQPGVDAVYPFLYDSKTLEIENVGFIMVQLKINNVSAKARDEIFRKMDPYQCNLLLPEDNTEDSTFPIPIIYIVFALSSNKQAVTQQLYEKPSEGHFTSYNFWCLGYSPTILQPIQSTPEKWKEMIGKADQWHMFYSSAPDLLHSELTFSFPFLLFHVPNCLPILSYHLVTYFPFLSPCDLLMTCSYYL